MCFDCVCDCNPARLDKRNVKPSCFHVTVALELEAEQCAVCKSAAAKAAGDSGGAVCRLAHHLGCSCSTHFGLQHDAIATVKKGKKDKPPAGRLLQADAVGTVPILSFFGTAKRSAAPPPRAALTPSGDGARAVACPASPTPSGNSVRRVTTPATPTLSARIFYGRGGGRRCLLPTVARRAT